MVKDLREVEPPGSTGGRALTIETAKVFRL
jgi:hypothetical protein